MSFSLELSADVCQVRDWVHEFAADVIRPAAEEWDEREETPWPILQEAAKVGLYSMEFFAAQTAEETGLGMPVAVEELFWGDAGISMSIMGTGLAAASLAANGTMEQLGEWLPQMYGDINEPKLAAFCSSEPGAGSDVSSIITRARYDEATDEWVLGGTKTWASNGGIANVHIVVASVYPELGSRGQASFIIPPGTKGFSQGQKFKKHGIRASHTAEVVLDGLDGRNGTRGRSPPPRRRCVARSTSSRPSARASHCFTIRSRASLRVAATLVNSCRSNRASCSVRSTACCSRRCASKAARRGGCAAKDPCRRLISSSARFSSISRG